MDPLVDAVGCESVLPVESRNLSNLNLVAGEKKSPNEPMTPVELPLYHPHFLFQHVSDARSELQHRFHRELE